MRSQKGNRKIVLPAIERDPAESFVMLERRMLYETYIRHQHGELELVLIVQGRGKRYVADSVEEYVEGDCCLIGSHTPHLWVRDLAWDGPVHAIVLQFRKDFLAPSFNAPELRKIERLLALAGRGLCIEGATRASVSAELMELFKEPIGSWRRPVALLGILGQLAESRTIRPLSAPRFQAEPDEAVDPRLEETLAFIEQHAADKFFQTEAAGRLGLSPSSFSRFFKRHMGKTFEDYVNHVRIGRACRALIETDQNVTDIAFEVGFNSLANFNRRFRRIKGMPPSEYRSLYGQRSETAAAG
jgi:AraC-like DNA-binding protein